MTENNRVEEAVPLLKGVLEDNPNHPVAHWQLSYAYRYAGMLSESIDEGKNREGIQLLKAVEARAEKGVVGDGEITYKLSQAYAVLSDTQSA